jgi:hypothetical protein
VRVEETDEADAPDGTRRRAGKNTRSKMGPMGASGC